MGEFRSLVECLLCISKSQRHFYDTECITIWMENKNDGQYLDIDITFNVCLQTHTQTHTRALVVRIVCIVINLICDEYKSCRIQSKRITSPEYEHHFHSTEHHISLKLNTFCLVLLTKIQHEKREGLQDRERDRQR